MDAFAYELHTFVCMGQALGQGTAQAPVPVPPLARPARPVAV